MSSVPVTARGDPLLAGSIVTLRTAANQMLEFEIIQPFTPFTKSQVYLGRSVSETDTRKFPPHAILKVYDPRYICNRLPPTPEYTTIYWSLEAETQAAERRKRVESGSAPDDFDEEIDKDVPEPWAYEEKFYRRLKESWENEVACLRKLEPFQGTIVPRLLESGSIILPPATRAIQPFAAAIEYVPSSRTLEQLTPAQVCSIPPSVFRPLVDGVSKFVENGVLHSEINAGNILHSPVESPTRAVLIDYCFGGVREDCEAEEAWELWSTFACDVEHLNITLRQKGIKFD